VGADEALWFILQENNTESRSADKSCDRRICLAAFTSGPLEGARAGYDACPVAGFSVVEAD